MGPTTITLQQKFRIELVLSLECVADFSFIKEPSLDYVDNLPVGQFW
jgi:hypothetical protein